MSSSPTRRRLPGAVIRRWLGRGALLATLSLLPQVVIPSGYDFTAQAQSTARKKLEDRPEAKIDKVGVLKPGTSKAPKDKAAPAARETRTRLEKATWPKTGKATADVAATGTAGLTVGGLGIKLAQQPTTPAATHKSRTAKAQPSAKATGPAEKVTLNVHSQAAAQKAGVNGVLLTVDPAGAAKASPPATPTSSRSRWTTPRSTTSTAATSAPGFVW